MCIIEWILKPEQSHTNDPHSWNNAIFLKYLHGMTMAQANCQLGLAKRSHKTILLIESVIMQKRECQTSHSWNGWTEHLSDPKCSMWNTWTLWGSERRYLFYLYLRWCHLKYCLHLFVLFVSLLRLPIWRGGVINSPRFCFFYFPMSKVGTPLIGNIADIAVYSEINTLFRLIL